MELKDIRTRDSFIQWLQESSIPVETYEGGVETVADWFIAVTNARMVTNMKDVAHLFLGGVKGINEDPETAHQEFWNSFFEEADIMRHEKECDPQEIEPFEREAVDFIRSLLESHFNIILE